MGSAPWCTADGGGMQLETLPVSPVPGTYPVEGLGADLDRNAFKPHTVPSSFLSSHHKKEASAIAQPQLFDLGHLTLTRHL